MFRNPNSFSAFLFLFLLGNAATSQDRSFFDKEITSKEVHRIEVSELDKTFRVHTIGIERRDGLWVIQSEFGFRVEKGNDVTELVQRFLNLRKTSAIETGIDPPKLKLIDPLKREEFRGEKSNQAVGVRFRFYDAKHNLLSDLIVGKTENKKTAIRVLKNEMSYWAKSLRTPSAALRDWIDASPLRIPKEDIQFVSLTQNTGKQYENKSSTWPFYLIESSPKSFTLLRNGSLTWKLPGIKADEELLNGSVLQLLDNFEFMEIIRVQQRLTHDSRPMFADNMELVIDNAEIETKRADLDSNLSFIGFDFALVDKKLFLVSRDKIEVGTKSGIVLELHLGTYLNTDHRTRLNTGEDEYYAIFRARMDERLISEKNGNPELAIKIAKAKANKFNEMYADWLFVVSVRNDLAFNRFFFTKRIELPDPSPVDLKFKNASQDKTSNKRFFKGIEINHEKNSALGRLIIWSHPGHQWNIDLKRVGAEKLISTEFGQHFLKPGSYRIQANPVYQKAVWNNPESYEFELKEHQTTIISLGGFPLEIEFARESKEGVKPYPVGVPLAQPFWKQDKLNQVGYGSRRPRGARYVSLTQPLLVGPHTKSMDAKEFNSICIFNPFQRTAHVDVRGKSINQSFLLPPRGTRLVLLRKRTDCSITSNVGQGLLRESRSIKGNDGLSLFTIGGGTAFVWKPKPDKASVRVHSARDSILAPAHVHAFEHPSNLLVNAWSPEEQLLKVVEKTTDRKADLDNPDVEEGNPDAVTKASGIWENEGPILSVTFGDRRRYLYPFVTADIGKPHTEKEGEIFAHPDFDVSLFRLPTPLKEKPIQSFAAMNNQIIVISQGEISDGITGEPLYQKQSESDLESNIASAILAEEGLLLSTSQARMATLENDQLKLGLSLVDPTLKLWMHPYNSNVYAFGGKAIHGGYQVEFDYAQPITRQPKPVTALGATKKGLLAGFNNEIHLRLDGDSRNPWRKIIQLPIEMEVVGIHDFDGMLVFSTSHSLYKLSAGIASPIVMGIGGDIYPYQDGLILRDQKSMKLYFVKSKLFRTSSK